MNGPIEPELQDAMKQVARAIDDKLPLDYGFALLVFRLGEGGFMNYVSNANRSDMCQALREAADQLERGDMH